MEALVLDTNFTSIGMADTFVSFIWTDRYSSCGDFEILTPSSKEMLELFQSGFYLWIKESEHVMIIEGFETMTDVESGNTIRFSGRSLESILDRRIVWAQTIIDGNLQNGVKKLLDENVISPSDEKRKIPNFIFEESTDERITQLKLSAQYTGDNLYDVICSICDANNLGFKITLNDKNQFVFKLYLGQDRSYDQEENVFVVFSPDYENIINSNYFETLKTLKNVTLVAGEGEGSARRTTTVGDGTGLERRELFTDARDISSTTDNGTVSDKDYMAQLSQRGEEKLADNKITRVYDGEMDTTQMYIYGTDYNIGDLIQVKNDFGVERKARIIEMIHSHNESENTCYPTFDIVGNDENSGS